MVLLVSCGNKGDNSNNDMSTDEGIFSYMIERVSIKGKLTTIDQSKHFKEYNACTMKRHEEISVIFNIKNIF